MKKRAVAIGTILLTVLAAWLLWRGKGEMRPRTTRPLNLLLISIDTLRPDHLGSYGYAPAQTPNIDSLAARGVRFTDAVTVSPLTLPAHTSLLTGTFPAYHGVQDNGGFYLNTKAVTLAKTLRDAGYRTGAFVGAFVLDSRWGLNQGFDYYFDHFDVTTAPEGGMDRVQRRGNEVADQALEWLSSDEERPFLAWVHLYDPHAAYEAPQSFASRFPPTSVGAYDAEIAFADAQVGRLIDRLSRDGRLDHTLVVIVGDHGESLGEHGEEQHGFFLYDATLRIPLILFGGGLTAHVARDQVRIVDVMPTVLDLMGLPIPPVVQGLSLRPVTDGKRLELLAFSETWYPRYHYGWSELIAVSDGRYKFILAPRRELYDTQADPGETTDLSLANSSRADAMEGALRRMQARVTGTTTFRAPQKIGADAEERLRALGYTSGGSGSRSVADGPRGDPKDKISLYSSLKLAGDDALDKNVTAAIAKVQHVLAVDDHVVEAHAMLGNLYRKVGRYHEAAEAYHAALVLDPDNEAALLDLALADRELGQLDEARRSFARVAALDPRSGRGQFGLADLAMQRGEFDQALSILTDALALNVERPAFLVKLGECKIALKRYDEAETHLREALDLSVGIARAHYDLGLIAEARQQTDVAMGEYETEIRHNPATFSASFNLGRLLSRAGRHAEAVTRFRSAVTSSPKFGIGYLYLAKDLLDVGDLKGAEQAAHTGLMLEPDQQRAALGHYALADVYSRLGRTRDAEREAEAGRLLERVKEN